MVCRQASGRPGHDLYLSDVWGVPRVDKHVRLSLPPNREFIEKHYVELKKANPSLPILIRECSDVQPKLWARYGERGSGQFGTPIGEQGLEKRRSSRVTQKPTVGILELGLRPCF